MNRNKKEESSSRSTGQEGEDNKAKNNAMVHSMAANQQAACAFIHPSISLRFRLSFYYRMWISSSDWPLALLHMLSSNL